MRTAVPAITKVTALALWLSVSVSGQAALATLSRDGLPVRRVLDGMVVLEATPSEISALRTVSGVNGISRDVLVSPLMTVAAKAIAANQARAGSAGLLGIGSFPAVRQILRGDTVRGQ